MRSSGFSRQARRLTSEDRLSAKVRKRLQEQGLLEAPPINTRPTGHFRWLPRGYWHEGSPYVLSEADWDGTCCDWAVLGGFRYTWHDNVSTRNSAGWFDRVWFKPGRAIFAELKVRYLNKSANPLSAAQKATASWAALAGLEVYHWLWPDDAPEAWEALTGKPWASCPYAEEVERHARTQTET